MEYIEKVTKGYSKDYKTAKGKTKTTNPSLSIYLGAKTGFSADETVIIANKDYFYKLLDNSKPSEELELELDKIKKELETVNTKFLEESRINKELNLELSRIKETLETKDQELKTTETELNHKIELLTKDNGNLNEIRNNLEADKKELKTELETTKKELSNKDQELTIANHNLEKKSNKIESLNGAIIYYKDVIAKYRELNIFKRIFKYDVEKRLDKPQLIELENKTND